MKNNIRQLIVTLVVSSIPLFAMANEKSSDPDFYIMGYETYKTSRGDFEGIYEEGTVVRQLPKNTSNQPPKRHANTTAGVTSEENTESFRKTLESFQKAISGLCISHLELSLAFNVSAKAWMVVSGEATGSVKVILKNPKESCPK